MLRRIFGPRKNGVTGEWENLHNEELNDLYPSPNFFRVVKWKKNEMGGEYSVYG